MDTQKQVDLGSWIGLQQAFAVVAGSCSAARAQCLRQVRDSKMLDDLGFTWEEFCNEYVGISRQQADGLIRQHSEFGDAYFRLLENPAAAGDICCPGQLSICRRIGRRGTFCGPRLFRRAAVRDAPG
jgi:hypothetical protein